MEQKKADKLRSLIRIVESWGFSLPDSTFSKLAAYHDLIVEKNEFAGLVSTDDVDRIVPRHFLESLALAREISFNPTLLVMDFGSGAGLPSIPLKIIFPEFLLYLVESKRKKALFLEKVIEDLQLSNTTVLAERGENLHVVSEYQGVFDIILARAVAPLVKIVPWCLPFLAEQGRIIIPGAPGDDLHKVERFYNILGGIRQIKMLSEDVKLEGARPILDVLELRQLAGKVGKPTFPGSLSL